MDNEEITDSNLLLPQITKYRGTDTMNLPWPEINPPGLLWIEGSSDPHKAETHREPSHIGPLIKLCQRRGKVARLKGACGFPGGRLEEQARGKCPHILALANTRTALRAWREDSGDITRILLAAVADPLARQGVKMSDTITLCIRILLTTQDLHGRKIDHGGSGGVRGTRGNRWKRNIAKLLSCSR